MSGDNHNQADPPAVRLTLPDGFAQALHAHTRSAFGLDPVIGGNHPMHPLVDADGHITATGETFIQRAGEIMDETVAKSVSGDNHNQADPVARVAWEVEHNPNGPIAQGVRKAVAAADRFSREFAALEREARGEVSS